MKWITYKEKEGVIARYVTWGLLGLMALFGSAALYRFLPIEDFSKTPSVDTFWGFQLFEIPFFEYKVRLSLIISLVLFVALAWLINRYVLNKQASADFLIDTEYEVRKVSWPSRAEYWGSSVAVIISTVIIGAFIFVVDIILIQLTALLYIR